MSFPTAKTISAVTGVTPATAREWLSGRRPISSCALYALISHDPSLDLVAFLKLLSERKKSPVDLRTQKSKKKSPLGGPRRRSVRERRMRSSA